MNNIKYQPSTVKFRDFSNYDINVINNELLLKNWDVVYNATSPNIAYDNLISILL